jgi:hypothetical protein
MSTLQKRKNRFLKLKIKCKHHEEDIAFLKRCKRVGVFPKFIEGGIKTRGPREAQVAVGKAKLSWLKTCIRERYAQVNRARLEMYKLHLDLSNNLGQLDWEEFERNTYSRVINHHNKKKDTLKKKFRKLVEHQKGSVREKIGEIALDCVVNKSKQHFTKEEMALLNKGLKFRLPNKKTPVEEIVVGVEAAIEFLSWEKKGIIREQTEKALKDNVSIRRSPDWKIVESLKEKEVVYSYPDKGKGVVILDKEDYNKAMEEHLTSGQYQKIGPASISAVDTYQKKVATELLDMMKEDLISKQDKWRLRVTNPRIPRMSGLPKIHKAGNQIRPVVTSIDAPTSRAAKEVVKLVRGIKIEVNYSVKNSAEIANVLKKETIQENEELVSFDVKALFPSVPETEAVELLKARIKENLKDDKEIRKLEKLVDLVVSQKVFQFNNTIYKQKSGLSIGCPLSPILAEVFMNQLEKGIMRKEWRPRFYRRYVDDIIAIVPRGQGEKILEEMNKMHKSIEFTIEKEKEGKIPFLDLMISREKGIFEFEVYRKPTDKPICIRADSYSPPEHKQATFESLFHRAYNLPLTKEGFKKEINYIYNLGKKNGFRREKIERVEKKHKTKKLAQQVSNLEKITKDAEPKECKRLLQLTYFPPLSEKIKRVARRNGIHSYYNSRGTLGDYLINLKDTRPTEAKSGIYEIECQDCEKKYVGQTKRRMQIRWAEHDTAYVKNRPKNSAIAEHCLTSNHKMGRKKVLKEVREPNMVNAYESYYINRKKKDLVNIAEPQTINSRLFTLGQKQPATTENHLPGQQGGT